MLSNCPPIPVTLKIPAGAHEVVFEFDPQSYRIGETISFVGSLLLILGLIGFLFLSFRKSSAGTSELDE